MNNKKPVRIQRSRQHKQVSPNGLPIVYVGRRSKWGNPFKVKFSSKPKNRLSPEAKGRDKTKRTNKTNKKQKAYGLKL